MVAGPSRQGRGLVNRAFQVITYPCPDHPVGDTTWAQLREVIGCVHCKREGETPGTAKTFLQVGSPELEAYQADPEAWIAQRQAEDIERAGYRSTDPE